MARCTHMITDIFVDHLWIVDQAKIRFLFLLKSVFSIMMFYYLALSSILLSVDNKAFADASSLICEDGKCTFTRIDTDAPAAVSPGGGGFGGSGGPCNPCSCPWCDDELFGMRNPQGIVTTPPSFDEFFPGELPCVIILEIARSEQLTSEQCAEIQFEPMIRQECGCPDLPEDPRTIAPVPTGNMSSLTPTMTPDTSLAPWTDPLNQDFLSDSVAITRDYRQGIFNALDPADNSNGPSGTLWARLPEGQTFAEARCDLSLCDWRSCFGQGNPPSMVGVPGVVHVVEEDLYYNIMFTNWTRGRNNDNNGDDTSLGGGFQYIRDEVPIDGSTLGACPVCIAATASETILRGPIDHSFVNVTIENVTPSDAIIEVLSVAQGHSPKCNYVPADSIDRVRPNGRLVGDTVQLRRTRIVGSVNPVRYTVRFSAEVSGSSCYGTVSVCVPAPGFTSCEEQFPSFDATSTRYCDAA